MVVSRKRLIGERIFFFTALFLTMVPLILLPLRSLFYHELTKLPEVHKGSLNLQNVDLTGQDPFLLSGEWEFYWENWIVTDQLVDAEPDGLVQVPLPWSAYDQRIFGKLPTQGYGSYRILLENCPDLDLISYIPNFASSYRVFLNGTQVASKGGMTKSEFAEEVEKDLRLQMNVSHTPLTPTTELVIEISSNYMGGLYLVPVLAQAKINAHLTDLRTTIAAGYAGILFFLLGCSIVLCFLGGKRVMPLGFSILTFFIFIRIILKEELIGVIKEALPFLPVDGLRILAQVLTLLSPIIFLICIRDMIGIPISKKILYGVLIFDILCGVVVIVTLDIGLVYLHHYFCVVSLLPFLWILYKLYGAFGKNRYLPHVSVSTLLILSSMISADQYTYGIVQQNISLFPSTCYVLAAALQVYIYLRKSIDTQREALESAQLRLGLKEAQTSLMLSQIQPHFLYNALIAIQVLCVREPETAQDALARFSKYLRMNMRSIKSHEPIPFEEEIEHIRNYVAIETLRFKERLTVRYDLQTLDFKVPPLTIQPLVENAIKHGVCKNIMGGTVTVKSYETKNHWAVLVEDDGPGFDPAILQEQSPNSIGLQNIRFRLVEVMGAQVEIRSEPGNGTKVLALLPKKQFEEEEA